MNGPEPTRGRPRGQPAASPLREAWSFLRYVVERFVEDRGPQVASALTYTSLLGLVPLLAILLAIFSAFPAFEALRESVKDMVLNPLMPAAAYQIREHLDAYLDNTRGLGGIGAIGLAVTALMMISTFESAFATIWRVREPRPIVFRFLLYWALLTIGPLLIGLSFSVSSSVAAVADRVGISTLAPQFVSLQVLVPALLGTAAFTLLYIAIPHWPVRFRHALAGAITATVLFELLKLGFTLYVGNGDNYRAIYGAIAVLPIFLLWLYCSWCVVLFGAEVTAALPEWASVRTGHAGMAKTPAGRLATALAVLWELWRVRGGGRGIRPAALERALGARWGRTEGMIAELVDRHYIVSTDQDTLLLARDLTEVPLSQLARDLGIGLELPADAGPDRVVPDPVLAPDWQATFYRVLADADAQFGAVMALSVGTLFAGRAEAPPGDPQPSPARGS